MIRFKQFISESINDKGIFKAIFFAGSPGAGKSVIQSKVSSGSIEPRVVNTDKPYEFLVHSYGGSFSGDTRNFVDRSIQLTRAQLFQYINGVLPLFIDGTSSDPGRTIQRAKILKSLGYDVGMIFVHTDLDTALSRAAKRERLVDPEFLKTAHARVQQNRDMFQNYFSTFYEFDNSSSAIDDAALMRLYRKTTGFFTAPIQNTIGEELQSTMIETGEQYLAPGIMSKEELNFKLTNWYRQR